MVPTAPPTLTLKVDAFERECARLASLCASHEPDLIVGIATGGVHVAEAMARGWSGTAPARATVTLSRPSTAYKKRLRADVLLSRIPGATLDRLRWLEVEARELLLRDRQLRRAHPIVDPPMVSSISPVDRDKMSGAERVLVVDDTVDSGRTLLSACNAVRAVSPMASIRTAVLTSTWRRPPVAPDYSLYTRTLIRFPWSFDS